ncbi:Plant cysteine oxidase 3-like protein [Drosera capensis]
MTRSTSSSKLQAIYELCKKSFASSGSPPPSSQSINSLCSLLDTLAPVDVGLKETTEDDRGYGVSYVNLFNRAARWSQSITYVDVHDCDSFTMCIFCFPTSSVIPLHDHPGMTVFSKVLYGSLHVKAYDWVEPPVFQTIKDQNSLRVRLAKLAADKVLTASSGTSVLFPKTGGNLHCFTAVTPCAVFDVLAPPYREAAGRRCTYYIDYPYSGSGTDDESGAELAWLKEVREPDDFYMQSGKYKGPALRI